MAEAEGLGYRLSRAIFAHQGDVRCLATAPDGTFVSGSRDRTAKLWRSDGEDYVSTVTFTGHSNFIYSVCILPPSSAYPWGLIVTGSGDCAIRGFLPDTNNCVLLIKEHTNTVCHIAPAVTAGFLSASWDKTAKLWDTGTKNCLATFEGHTQAVWCVLQLPNGNVVTGSADCTIKIFHSGQCIRTLKGHKECVRGLSLLKESEFLSCSNDGTIRHWNTDSGHCINCFKAHPSYIYSISISLDCKLIATSGEDSYISIRRGEQHEHFIVPAQSVWDVKFLANSDLVTACSDGVIRIFTSDPSRFGDESLLKHYEEEINQFHNKQELGGYKLSDFPGKEALLIPGKKEGQIKVINEGTGGAVCYKWSCATSSWEQVGSVVGAKNEKKTGKVIYEGQEYDRVFDVDIEDGRPPLKLPFNYSDDPSQAAQTFLIKNNLSIPLYLEQVTNFIIQNVPKSEFYTPGFSDPFTGSSRYTPTGTVVSPATKQSVMKTPYFPQKSYITFDIGDPPVILCKLQEFNNVQEDKLRLENLSLTIEKLLQKHNSSLDYSKEVLALTTMMKWKQGNLFPVMDVMRLAVRERGFSDLLLSGELGQTIINLAIDLLNYNSTVSNKITSLRLISNMFVHPVGELIVLKHKEEVLKKIYDLALVDAKKQIQVGISTILLNFTVALQQGKFIVKDLSCFIETCTETLVSISEPEAVFRLLVAIGSLYITVPGEKKTPHSLLPTLIKLSANKENTLKVIECSKDLLTLLNQ